MRDVAARLRHLATCLRAVSGKLPAACAVALLGAVIVPSANADFTSALEQYRGGDYEAAATEFLTLAGLGEVGAQYNLGIMALQGQGAPKDAGAAAGWLQAAAENGSRRIQPEKVAELRAKLSDEQRRAADAIVGRYGRTALLASVLPVPEEQAYCPGFSPAFRSTRQKQDFEYYMRHRKDPALQDAVTGGTWTHDGIVVVRLNGDRWTDDGIVILQLTVGVDGTARDPEVLLSLPADYTANALALALHTRFEPARQAGQRVESRRRLTVLLKATGGSLWHIPMLERSQRAIAKEGDPLSQFVVGLVATVDPGTWVGSATVPRLGLSPADAHRLLVFAAQGGHAPAQYWAAQRFMSLLACQGDRKKLPWLRAAAAAGEAAAQLALALELMKDLPSGEQLAEAKSLLEQAARTDDFYVTKHVTALLASSPMSAIRDPAGAAAAARKLLQSTFESDPQAFEAIAAADAATGDFASAVDRQQLAIRTATELQWNTQMMEQRLAAYRLSKPWVGDLFAIDRTRAQ